MIAMATPGDHGSVIKLLRTVLARAKYGLRTAGKPGCRLAAAPGCPIARHSPVSQDT